MNKRLLNFRADENQMIDILCKFYRWTTGKELTQEEREDIASFVMEGHLSLYEVGE